MDVSEFKTLTKTLKQNENACLCCLTQNNVMINLENCTHGGFLQDYYSLETPTLVCNNCHIMLKKINIFRKQIQESCDKLKQQESQNTTTKLFTLQQTDTATISILSETEALIKKTKIGEDDTEFESHVEGTTWELTPDEKIEHDSSDIEDDIPLTQLKKKKKRARKVRLPSLKEKYNGKIRIVILSQEELLLERERASTMESYLKLPFKCESCIKGYDHENTLITHNEKQHKKNTGYRCDICSSVLGTENSYKAHARRHVTRFECVACGKRTLAVDSVSQHYNQIHGESAERIDVHFSCKLCDYTTDSHRDHRYHRNTHKEKQLCAVCSSTFVNASGLRAHMYTVHKQSTREFKCSTCDKTYRQRSSLHSHNTSYAHSGSLLNVAYCGMCCTQFATRNNLCHHLKTHSNHVTEESRRFICTHCGAKFLTNSALRAHVDWEHLKTFKHVCHICVKIFKTASNLKRHISYVHEKKRPPRDKICDYCGQAFTTTTILVSHVRTHPGARPLRCTQCSATFWHASALYKHNKEIHMKYKPKRVYLYT